MAAAFALAIISGKIIFNFVNLKNLRIFQIYIFTRGAVADSGICCTRSPAGSCRAATEGPTNRRNEKMR